MVSRSIFIIFLLSVMSIALIAGDEIDIPYSKHVLENGLTVIIHEDHKAPIVAVNVWYHVGSKNEKSGKTGFAHLFEHLMFNGSENFDDDYFQAMERIGATDLNGTTNEDRTNYFQNVPSSALDIALWMESDRMGYLLGAITQEKLDEQRGVVQNEKRQGENQPYGKVYTMITENTYPKGHPYSWSVIGSMEDLDAAALEDVHEWFKSYYGPNNATVVIAGDVKTEDALARAKHFFGSIPASPPIAKYDTWIAKMTGSKRQVMQDRVPQSRIYMVWNVPPWGTEEMTQFDLLTDLLAAGKTSRLYKRLVYDDQIATDVRAFVDSKEIAGQLMIYATAKPGEDLKQVEMAINEELARLLKDGPTEKEVKRIQNRWMANFIRGIERIGGFGGKSDILAQNQVYGGSPEFYKKTIARVQKLTPKAMQMTAKKWLSDGVYILEVHPYPDYSAATSEVDRSKLPEAGTPPNASFPTLQRETLSNGLKVILAEWPSVPIVRFNLLVDAGYAADQFAAPGAARLAMDMIDEGTKKRSSLEISEELSGLGASLSSGSNLDMSTVSLSTLKSTLDEALDIYADVILDPSFPENEFQRLQKQTLARIQREKKTPIQMALRVFPELLYGKDHAYGNPLTGSGTEATVAAMKRDDLAQFHQTWFRPNNATLVVVGATTMKEIKPKLEKLFSDWDGGAVPKKNVANVDYLNKKRLFLIDRPGSLQSIIFAGHVAPPSANPEREAMRIANNILGGEFTARVNMNLREDKHWAYGAFTFMWPARGQRPFIAYAPVQTDKTVESMQEISKELTEFVGVRPATADEFKKAKENEILALPGSWETMRAVSGSISEIVNYGLTDDYYIRYPEKLKSLTLGQVNNAAKNMVKPDNVVWVVVGDREKIEAGLRQAGFNDIQMMDSDGQPMTSN